MNVRLSGRARVELINAVEWYEKEREGLGFKFRNAVAKASELAAEYPNSGVLVRDGVRRKLVHPFPYSIYYALAGDALLVLAIFHGRRDPEWLKDLDL
jgi:plasmid stabilization system protein ParE